LSHSNSHLGQFDDIFGGSAFKQNRALKVISLSLDLDLHVPTLAAKIRKLHNSKILEFIQLANTSLTQVLSKFQDSNIVLMYDTEIVNPIQDSTSVPERVLFFPIHRGPAISQAIALRRQHFTTSGVKPSSNSVLYLIN
jgi:hypothetical protein